MLLVMSALLVGRLRGCRVLRLLRSLASLRDELAEKVDHLEKLRCREHQATHGFTPLLARRGIDRQRVQCPFRRRPGHLHAVDAVDVVLRLALGAPDQLELAASAKIGLLNGPRSHVPLPPKWTKAAAPLLLQRDDSKRGALRLTR